MNMDFERRLAIPAEVKEQYPVTGKVSKIVEKKRNEIKAVFEGRSDKMILIIGPCSADNEDAVLDYMNRLVPVQEKVAEKILLVPRIYTNKPRTTGEGYKGMLHQPDPEAKPDLFKGIVACRRMHMRAVEETGFVFADEMLYPENYQYLDDILGYVAVGARSVEDQQHRLTASGIEVPVGMKNPTSGDYSVMLNAILRGSTNKHGNNQQNYHYEDLIRLCDAYEAKQLKNPAVIIDTNHSNSNKNPFEQPRIVMDVLNSCRHNQRIQNLVKGFMIESYIEDGCQKIGEGCYGKSITDPCLGWEKSEQLIYDIADKL